MRQDEGATTRGFASVVQPRFFQVEPVARHLGSGRLLLLCQDPDETTAALQGLAAFKKKDRARRIPQVVILAVGSPKHPVPRRARRLRGTRCGRNEGAGRRRRPLRRGRPTRCGNERERHDEKARKQASRNPNPHWFASVSRCGCKPVAQNGQPADMSPARALTSFRAKERKAGNRKGAGPRRQEALGGRVADTAKDKEANQPQLPLRRVLAGCCGRRRMAGLRALAARCTPARTAPAAETCRSVSSWHLDMLSHVSTRLCRKSVVPYPTHMGDKRKDE